MGRKQNPFAESTTTGKLYIKAEVIMQEAERDKEIAATFARTVKARDAIVEHLRRTLEERHGRSLGIPPLPGLQHRHPELLASRLQRTHPRPMLDRDLRLLDGVNKDK